MSRKKSMLGKGYPCKKATSTNYYNSIVFWMLIPAIRRKRIVL